MRQPGANTIEVINEIKSLLPRFEASLPAGLDMQIRFDRSETIQASIDEVQKSLLIAGALVVGVIFLFLRRASATIIPSLALPIAVVGTFAGMSVLDYSLDNLSLMALTLSVGFVVDDAIVMLENIVRHMEMGKKPYRAAIDGAAEIGFTILSMTVSLAAVFIPIVFMSGIVGRLLHEFAVTIVIAVLASGLVSLTLTPMLCARFLRDEHELKQNAFHRASERAFLMCHAAYERSLRWSLEHKPVDPRDVRCERRRDDRDVRDHARGLPAGRRHGRRPDQRAGGERHFLRAHGRVRQEGRGHRQRGPEREGLDAPGELERSGVQQRASPRDAQAARRAQALGRGRRARAASQAREHHGRERVRHEPAGDQDRRPQLAVELSVHAPGHRPRPASARRDRARRRAQDDAGLHRCEQRL